MKKINRINELDILRGLAVIGMITYHYFFILEYFQYADVDILHGWLFIMARFVQFSFLGLVGISIAISTKSVKQQWVRALKVMLLALVVTLATAIFAPHAYVKFGVLHHIAVSIFLLAPISKKPKLALIFGLLAIIIGQYLETITSASWPLILLGSKTKEFAALDHFAIFPWIGVTLIGIFIGNTLYKNKTGLLKFKVPFLEFLGRHTLILYMIHVPILLVIAKLLFDK